MSAQECTWKESSPHGDMPYTWEGECGACWYFDEGTPKENDVRFCPKCGKPIVEVKYQEDDDE